MLCNKILNPFRLVVQSIVRKPCRGGCVELMKKFDQIHGNGCWCYNSCRYKNSCSYTGMKVCILGAGGCTGQPLALLLKQSLLLDEVALYDLCPTWGYAMELNHVNTKCRITSFSGRNCIDGALEDARVVIILARDKCDSFESNAPVVVELAVQICNYCTTPPFIIVATEPIESMVPLVAEVQRLRSAYNPRKLLGCVELNCVRANTVMADFLQLPPEAVRVPVIGGARAETMVPVLSSAKHPCEMTHDQIQCLTSSIMSGNEAVCAAKGMATATPCLAGAYGIARTTLNVVKGLQGNRDIRQCAYVDSLGTCAPECQFFSNEVQYGPSGIEKNLGVPELSKFENCLLFNALPFIRCEIARAINLIFTMCSQTGSFTLPCHMPPTVDKVPSNWEKDSCKSSCKDQYLAAVCREVLCNCVSCNLLWWKPQKKDLDAARARNMTYQQAIGESCCNRLPPKSIRLAQAQRDNIRFKKNVCS